MFGDDIEILYLIFILLEFQPQAALIHDYFAPSSPKSIYADIYLLLMPNFCL